MGWMCSVSLADPWPIFFKKHRGCFKLTNDFQWQDLANQIRFSKVYKQALIASGERPGRFLTPSAAEFMSGDMGVAGNPIICFSLIAIVACRIAHWLDIRCKRSCVQANGGCPMASGFA